MKFRIYGDRDSRITPREEANRSIALQVAQEGIVLLKNDGTLPLKDKNIVLFGAGSRKTIKGGTGSGDVQERYSVSIEDGLKNHGFHLLSTSWIDRYDRLFEKEKAEWRNGIEKRIRKYPFWRVQAMFDEVIHVTPFRYPQGDLIRQEDMPSCSTALYVIARQAGESNDRKPEKGDYYLSDIENENIHLLARHYPHIIVIINCGGIVDLSSLDDISLSGVLFLGQPGEEGGNALASILDGSVTPSGKLTDTWALRYEDYPNASSFGSLGNVYSQDYTEGLYVGYRYFDTFQVKPRYGFGFGLSYTSFVAEVLNIQLDKDEFSLRAKVTNKGSLHVGKEVLQLYLTRPKCAFSSPLHELAAFAKTDLLAPNESQEVVLSFDLSSFAFYDEENSRYFLAKGYYVLSLGTQLCEANPVAAIEVDQDIITFHCHRECPCPSEFKELEARNRKDIPIDGLPCFLLDPSLITAARSRDEEKVDCLPQTEAFLKKLSQKEQLELTIGGGYFGKTFNITPSAAGTTTSRLLKKGIVNLSLSDGPAGLRLSPKNALTRSGGVRYVDEIPDDWNWGWIKKIGRLFLAKPGKGYRIYQYMTAFPCETTQASTFNRKLIEDVGIAIGEEMKDTGITLWLAPGINLHRNPLCGRNFEYYSEDPLLTAEMAISITRGVQSLDGLGVTIKHFCCNNQEDQRMYMTSNVKERTLRELYLKAFELIVKSASPKAIMTSYNKLNGVYNSNNKDLCIDILRKEWGFTGIVMTDWTAAENDKGDPLSCLSSGNDLIEPGSKAIRKILLKGLQDGKIDSFRLQQSATRILNLIFSSRVSHKEDN